MPTYSEILGSTRKISELGSVVPHTPALGIVLDAQRLGSVDGGNGLYMVGLEALGGFARAR